MFSVKLPGVPQKGWKLHLQISKLQTLLKNRLSSLPQRFFKLPYSHQAVFLFSIHTIIDIDKHIRTITTVLWSNINNDYVVF